MQALRDKLANLLYWDERPAFVRVIEKSGFSIDRINTEDMVGMPLVHQTLLSDSFEWFVATYKPNLEALDCHGRSIVFYGISRFKHMPWLVSRGVNIHLRDSNNESPVMFAARYACTPMVCLLLDHGASLKDAYAGFELRKKGIESDALKGSLESYYVRQEECKQAAISILALKKRKVFHHDMLTLIAKHIWLTRVNQEWEIQYR